MRKIKKYDLENCVNVLSCVFYGALCGALTGVFTLFFKFLAKKCEVLSRFIYQYAKSSAWYVVLVFCGLVAFSLVAYLLHERLPESKGGGIPRSEGVLRGLLSFKWLRALIGTFIGSIIGFLCGIPVGGEGPSVLMGTAIGGMCASISKDKSAWGRYVMSGGAGAGFAVATGAPFAGILFVIEEVHKRFSLMLVITVSVSVIVASVTGYCLGQLLGMEVSFVEFTATVNFALSDIGYLLLLGVIMALAVGFFDWSIACFGKFTKKLKKYLPKWLKLLVVFVITGVFGFLLTDAIYSGHEVIVYLTQTKPAIITLVTLIILRLTMMLFVTDSGVTGGIFIPTLAIGALIGALVSKLLVTLGMKENLQNTIIMLSMCAFIGGSLRAPFTATVLFLELTEQFTDLLYVALVIFTVTVINELFNQLPFYDKVLKNMEEHEHEGKALVAGYFKMEVKKSAFVVGKVVKEIMWPPSCAVLSVSRKVEGQDGFEDALDEKIREGDTITLRARYYEREKLVNSLKELIGREGLIEDYTALK